MSEISKRSNALRKLLTGAKRPAAKRQRSETSINRFGGLANM